MRQSAFIILKGINSEISYRLSSNEFDCKCTNESCYYTIILKDTIDAWALLRKAWGKPLKINSGYRCQAHNAAQPGSSTKSRHSKGSAIDISTANMSSTEIKEFTALAKACFSFILEYPTFLHCDMR